jgi:hypothetical protein
VAKFVKSNAIVYAKQRQTIGVGAGQMSRVNSARIAAIKAEHAGLQVQGAVMASDAFFPFRDGIDNAAKAGISAVIQPGGSMRDAKSSPLPTKPASPWCSPACATSATNRSRGDPDPVERACPRMRGFTPRGSRASRTAAPTGIKQISRFCESFDHRQRRP